MKKLLAVVSVLVCFSSVAQAIELPFNLGVDAGVSWGLGPIYNQTKNIQSRTMNTIDLHVFPGYRFMGVLVGPMFDLGINGQNTDPLVVNNTNLKGTSWLLGLGAEYSLFGIVLSAGYDFLGRYSESYPAAGMDASYSKPSGLVFRAGYMILPFISVDASYRYASYSTSTLGVSDIDISANKVTQISYAVGASFHL